MKGRAARAVAAVEQARTILDLAYSQTFASETLRPPGAQYYLLVTAGLVASLAVIASTLPLLRRLTGLETARND